VQLFVNTFFEGRVEHLFDLAALVEKIFSSAGLEYRIVGGLAAYLYLGESEPDAGRLTKRHRYCRPARGPRENRPSGRAVRSSTPPRGWSRTLAQAGKPSARRAVHLVFTGEKVRPEYPEPTPALGPCRKIKELRLIPLGDLVRMKLTRFRTSDKAHLKDLDQAGLITRDIESALSPVLAERLAQVRARA
jgi:hypothetical protein